MAQVFRRSTRIGLTRRTIFVFPVNIHEKEETERNDGEKRFEEVTSDDDKTLAEGVEAGDGEENHHDCFCGGGVT
ncbi:hypothetical protein Lal_00029937 [Lupinus albus]|nr:hypothetical protein Lal_00029937 [Lupinus albus]